MMMFQTTVERHRTTARRGRRALQCVADAQGYAFEKATSQTPIIAMKI